MNAKFWCFRLYHYCSWVNAFILLFCFLFNFYLIISEFFFSAKVCATMHSTFTASVDGYKVALFVLLVSYHFFKFLSYFLLILVNLVLPNIFIETFLTDNSQWNFQKYGHQERRLQNQKGHQNSAALTDGTKLSHFVGVQLFWWLLRLQELVFFFKQKKKNVVMSIMLLETFFLCKKKCCYSYDHIFFLCKKIDQSARIMQEKGYLVFTIKPRK